MYIKNSIQYQVLQDLHDISYEIIWVHIHPHRLPRGIPSLIMATLYHPPSADDPHLLDHLVKSLFTIESIFPNSGVILLGDFNELNISRLKYNFKLKQIFKFATCGRNKLDLI